jgi:hypothetical protein
MGEEDQKGVCSMEWVDGEYRITVTGWKDCTARVECGVMVECNYPLMVGRLFTDLLLWFMEASPSRGVLLRRER